MTGKKVELAYITDDSKRRTTFRKRKNGLIKKAEEITTLCGIEACAIIYAPNESQPQVWPSLFEARKVISKFERLPEYEKSRKMLNHRGYLQERIKKVQEQLNKQGNDNWKNEMEFLMFLCISDDEVLNDLNMVDLKDLSTFIDQNLEKINQKIDVLEGEANITEEQEHVEVIQNQPQVMDNIVNGGKALEVNPSGEGANLENGY